MHVKDSFISFIADPDLHKDPATFATVCPSGRCIVTEVIMIVTFDRLIDFFFWFCFSTAPQIRDFHNQLYRVADLHVGVGVCISGMRLQATLQS